MAKVSRTIRRSRSTSWIAKTAWYATSSVTGNRIFPQQKRRHWPEDGWILRGGQSRTNHGVSIANDPCGILAIIWLGWPFLPIPDEWITAGRRLRSKDRPLSADAATPSDMVPWVRPIVGMAFFGRQGSFPRSLGTSTSVVGPKEGAIDLDQALELNLKAGQVPASLPSERHSPNRDKAFKEMPGGGGNVI